MATATPAFEFDPNATEPLTRLLLGCNLLIVQTQHINIDRSWDEEHRTVQGLVEYPSFSGATIVLTTRWTQ